MELITIEAKCISKNESVEVSTVVFGVGEAKTDKGISVKKAFTYQTTDPAEVKQFIIGKIYNVIVSEKLQSGFDPNK